MRRTATIFWMMATSVAFVLLSGAHASAQQTTCSSFTSQEQAQQYYDEHRTETQLDSDGDGQACEGLPSSGAAATPAATLAPGATPSTIPNNGAESGVMAMSGLSLIEAGYGLTLLARRYGVKRRAVPMYLLRKMVSAGKAGEFAVPLGEDIYLVHESALTQTSGIDLHRTTTLSDDVFELELLDEDLDDDLDGDAEFRPDALASFDELIDEEDDEFDADDPWAVTFGWRV